MKTIKTWLTTIVVLLCSIPMNAQDFEVDGISYSITSSREHTVEVNKVPKEYEGLITIPSSVYYRGLDYSVTSIGDYAFAYCYGLTSVTLPDGLVSIGFSAFSNCTGLASITIPNSVKSIEGSAFAHCTGLTSITLPDSVESISTGAFEYCTGLTSITIPNSVKSIGSSAFAHCTGLTSIILPDGLSTIDRSVFYGCSSLTSITLPDALTTIAEVAFYNCSSLTSINIPSSVTSIGIGAFNGCVMLPTENNIRYADKWAVGVADKSLKTCTLLDNTVAIGGGAFYNCASLTTIGLPDGLGSIGDETFYGCTSLASITLPKGLTSIGSSAFEACSSLASIILPDILDSIANKTFYGCSGLTSITLPNGMTSLGGSAFEACTSLASITLPKGLTSIGSSAFEACSSLASITLPNAMTSIGSSAFKDCSALISVTLPDSLNNIGVETFYGCSSLTLISLPSTLNSIGRSAFQECCNLDLVVNYSKLNISKGSESHGYVAYYASRVIDADGNVGDFIFDKMNERYYLTAYMGSDSIVVLPESYKGNKYFIGSSAFENCSGLTSISIPSTVTGISSGAFEDCVKLPTENDVRYADKWAVGVTDKSLTTYTLRDNTVGIADSVFAECTKLSSITLPDVLANIGIEAFCGCRSLTSIILPNSLTSIGSYAFYDCDNLVEVLNLSDLDISKGSKSHGYVAYYAKRVYNADEMVGDYAFKESIGNNYLVRYVGADSIITLPQDYKGNKYGIDNEAFYGCSRLISVTFPDSLTSIGSYAFYGCRGLTSITFPDGLTSIGNYAFYDCSGLASISLPDDLSSIGSYAFYDCDNLVEVLNLSDLDISKGSKSHGYVAYYAKRVYNADEMVGDYAFKESIGNNYLVRYVGADSIITLPQDYKGNKYGIDNEAFYGCSRLISVTFPDSLTSIGSYAFYGCSGLTSITLPDGLRSIVDKTFYGCSSLTSISIPSSVMSIATDAFDGCVMLPTENSVRYADKWAVGVTDKYRTTYALRENTVGIGGGVFAECAKLSSITLPDVLVSIGVNAFCGCHSLTSITLPKSLTSIGSSAFSRCNNLVEVLNLSDLSISKGSKSHGYVAYYAERVYNADEMVGDYAFKESDGKNYLVRYVGDDKSITLPENYKDNNYNIGEEAFYGCGFLTSIVIPNSVQVIGNDAFYGCKLSSLTIGTGVRSIGSSSSESNKPKKVFWLPSRCPDGYKNLDGELNYVPNDQYYVSNRKIYPYLSSMFEVNNMKYVPVSPAERTCDLLDCIYDSLGSVVEIEETVSYKGIPMTVQNVGAQTFYGLKNIKEVYVSSSVQESAFAYCDSLTKVTFGDNAKIIGTSAFEGCSSLSDVKIGTNVRSIEDNAFKDCSYLNNIEIADSVENIGVSAFSGCSSLSAIAIPQATETIKSSAFSGCSSLTKIIIEDRASKLTFGGKKAFEGCPLDSVYIGGKINGIPFSENKSLRSVTFANNVDSIYASEFYGCSNLKNVAMGDAVSSIGYQAFSGCSSLESFTFASAMKTIGDKAFSGCTSMTSLISLATTPPACGNQALDDIDKWSCVLKVPESSIPAYQAADGWKEFFFIESLPTAITEITEDGNHCNGTNVYTIGGMKVTNTGKLSKGIYIVDGKKVIID